ncbi:MAG: hypothetical protein N2115_01070 [bacterium]|nr:hypothetical protein [bacterium]
MINYRTSIKTHLIIMIVLYGGTWFILNNFVMQQQQKILKEYKEKKAKLEYDYLRIKNYPEYVKSIQSIINYGKDKLNRFTWLNTGYDPNLVFFKHISALARKAGIQIISLNLADRDNDKYYFWDVSFQGNFSGIFNLIRDIESSQKFLKIESAEITKSENAVGITVKISGIKKLE